MTVASDGALLVVDQQDTDPRSAGGQSHARRRRKAFRLSPTWASSRPTTWRLTRRGASTSAIPARMKSGASTPMARTARSGGSRPRSGDVQPAVTGLAYDATGPMRSSITDPEINEIYRVAVGDGTQRGDLHHGERSNPPGFDGITVTAGRRDLRGSVRSERHRPRRRRQARLHRRVVSRRQRRELCRARPPVRRPISTNPR